MVFVRTEETNDKQAMRQARLTSGDNSFKSTEVLYAEDGEIAGIELEVYPTSDDKEIALCKKDTPWRVILNVKCDSTLTGPLAYDNLKVKKNNDQCTLRFNAVHKAGCGAIKASGFVQYLNSNPWVVALVMIGAGIAACFFGGLLFDYIMYTVPAIVSFLFVAVVVSSFGLFTVLEEDIETTTGGVFKAIFGFTIALAVAIVVGFLAKNTKKIAMGILGGIGSFFLGFLFYSLVFAMFIKSTTILLWITLIVFTVAGTYFVYTRQEDLEVHLTVFIGAYLIIRGLSYFLGGFPNEAETFFELQRGKFNLPLSFFGYLLLFIVLNVAGTWFQHFKEYHKATPKKVEEQLNQENNRDDHYGKVTNDMA